MSCRLSLLLQLFSFASFSRICFHSSRGHSFNRSSICRRPDSHTCFSFFIFSLWRRRFFPSIFCTIAALYGEYVVRFFLPGGVLLPCDHGLDVSISLCENSINQPIKTVSYHTAQSRTAHRAPGRPIALPHPSAPLCTVSILYTVYRIVPYRTCPGAALKLTPFRILRLGLPNQIKNRQRNRRHGSKATVAPVCYIILVYQYIS